MLTPNSVEVTWDQLSDVTGYLISCTTTASYAGGKSAVVNDSDTTRHILTNLVENTPYDITAQGFTRDGRKGLCSNVVSVKTSTTGKQCVATRVKTRLGHPSHVLSRSSGSHLLYKMSGSDPDSALNQMIC